MWKELSVAVLFLLPLLLGACGGSDLLPSPPSLPPSPPASTSPTTFTPPRPASTATPTTPTATATVTPTPTPSPTPTPALPEMTVLTDPNELLRVRVPRDWTVQEERSTERLELFVSSPDRTAALLVGIAPSLGDEQQLIQEFISGFVNEGETLEQETLEDGTIRLTGTLAEGRQVEMRLQHRATLFGAIIVAAEPARWAESERIFEEAFATFHFFPGNGPALFGAEVAIEQKTIDPSHLEVVGVNHYYSDAGTLWVIGEVTHQGELDAEGVTVTVELLSADGQVVATEEGHLDLELLLAGQSAPFLALFDRPPAPEEWVVAQARAEANVASFFLTASHKGLLVEPSVEATAPTADSYLLAGRVRNEGKQAARFTRVIGALYDESGRLLATTSTYLQAERLEPGQSSPFELRFFSLASEASAVARHRLWVTGSKAEP